MYEETETKREKVTRHYSLNSQNCLQVSALREQKII